MPCDTTKIQLTAAELTALAPGQLDSERSRSHRKAYAPTGIPMLPGTRGVDYMWRQILFAALLIDHSPLAPRAGDRARRGVSLVSVELFSSFQLSKSFQECTHV